MKIINQLLISLIISFRPFLGPSPSGFCKYELGCTEFAIKTLNENALSKALRLIIQRLFSCQPFNRN